MNSPSRSDQADIEKWAPIKELPKYLISTKGRVKGVHGKLLKPTLMQIGYLIVTLSNGASDLRKRYLHRLVATTFIGEIKKGYVVNHIDNNKTNNTLSNLEIISREKNAQHWAINNGKHSRFGQKKREECPVHNSPYHETKGGHKYCKSCRAEKLLLKKSGSIIIPPTNTGWKLFQRKNLIYLVSRDGRVWSCAQSKLISPGVNLPGYLYCNLAGKNFAISRLVAELFIRPIEDGEVVDHIDQNKLNNNLDNLRIISRSENTRSFQKAKITANASLNSKQRIKADDAKKIIYLQYMGIRIADLSRQFSVAQSTIQNIISGLNFKYLERPFGPKLNTRKLPRKSKNSETLF